MVKHSLRRLARGFGRALRWKLLERIETERGKSAPICPCCKTLFLEDQIDLRTHSTTGPLVFRPGDWSITFPCSMG